MEYFVIITCLPKPNINSVLKSFVLVFSMVFSMTTELRELWYDLWQIQTDDHYFKRIIRTSRISPQEPFHLTPRRVILYMLYKSFARSLEY